jgi:CheY-like chemotaxis protein
MSRGPRADAATPRMEARAAITSVIYVAVTRVVTVERMTLSSMVVSRDWQEISVLECILGGLHMEVAVESEPQRALARLTKSKIDALIVDCDLNGSGQFFRELQNETSRSNSVPLVIMGKPQGRRALEESGALFAFDKPISVEQAVHTLSAARNMILDGRLRYHRAGLEVPVLLRGARQKKSGQLINLSQGGLQVRLADGVDVNEASRVSFALPGLEDAVNVETEVAWSDERGNVGLRFVKMAPPVKHALGLWLARQYFAN